MILDFLNEQLPWRNCKENKVDEVRDIKAKCLADPENQLWKTTTASIPEVRNIFYSLSALKYEDRPDYEYIQSQLQQILDREVTKTAPTRVPAQVKRKRKSKEELPVMESIPEVEGVGGKVPRIEDLPFPAGAAAPPPAASLPPLIPPSYLPPNGYMLPPPGYQNLYYNYPFNQLMMPGPLLGSGDELRPNEEQKMDPAAMQKQQYLPFHPLMMPYSGGFGKDRIQFVSPNFININNVNTLGTALIINNGMPHKPADAAAGTPAAAMVPEPKKVQLVIEKDMAKDGFFRVEIDQEYYRKLYSAEPH